MSDVDNVRAIAMDVLARVEAGAFSDRLLPSRESSLADGRDRRFLHRLVLTTLRWQLAMDPLLAPRVRGPLSRLRPLVRAALRQGLTEALVLGKPSAVAVSATVDALKLVDSPKAAGLVNAVLRRLLAEEKRAPSELTTVPAWLLERWRIGFGEERSAEIVRAMNRPARAFLLARADRGGRVGVGLSLAEEGIETEASSRLAEGLRVLRGAPQLSAAFARGDFVLLDEASALIAELATPLDGGCVLDLTAAPGGKTAVIAQHPEVRIVASDLDQGRVRLLGRNMRWLAPPGRVAVARADARHAPFPSAGVDALLLDAPCSGSGTLRSRPEKRIRLRLEDVERCARLQASLLDAAATLVRPGGTLVYSVCSLEPEEGRRQIERFLVGHPEYRAEDPRDRLGIIVSDLVAGDPPLLEALPDSAEVDGFVAARLVRGA